MPNLDRPDDAIKAYKAKKALEQKEAEEYYKEFEKEAAKYDLQSTDDDLYLCKKIDNAEEAEEPTNDLVNKDVGSLEAAKLIGQYEDVYERATKLSMDRAGYKNFIHYKKLFQSYQDKQEKLDLQITASSEQTEKLDALFDKISDILDDEELEAKLTKFKDAIKASAPAPVASKAPEPAKVPAPVPAATHYDPYTACITIKHKPEPVAAHYDPYAAPITRKKEVPEEWTHEKLLDEYYCEEQLKRGEQAKVLNLEKQLKEMKKQLEDYNKYKMFYIKNNGTDTAAATNDKLKLFISSNYEITTNHKDRIKTSTLHKEYSTIAQMDIKIFISKCKDLGMEVIKASGYNVFTCIKAKEAI